MVVMTEENTEVRRARRSWPARYKLDVLEEIDQAKLTGEPGAVGEILRREDLYSSLITEWRKQRDAGALRDLTDTKEWPLLPPARKPAQPGAVPSLRRFRIGDDSHGERKRIAYSVRKTDRAIRSGHRHLHHRRRCHVAARSCLGRWWWRRRRRY